MGRGRSRFKRSKKKEQFEHYLHLRSLNFQDGMGDGFILRDRTIGHLPPDVNLRTVSYLRLVKCLQEEEKLRELSNKYFSFDRWAKEVERRDDYAGSCALWARRASVIGDSSFGQGIN
jgi:hypothetical protein